MDQPFDARLELDEGAVVNEADDSPLDLLALCVALRDPIPGAAAQLLQAQGDARALRVDLQDDDLHLVAYGEHLRGVLDAPPGHVVDVEQAVDATGVDEAPVVGDVLDGPLDDRPLSELRHGLPRELLLALLQHRLARHHDVSSGAGDLLHLHLYGLAHETVELPDGSKIAMARREEGLEAVEIDREPALRDREHTHAGPLADLEVPLALESERDPWTVSAERELLDDDEALGAGSSLTRAVLVELAHDAVVKTDREAAGIGLFDPSAPLDVSVVETDDLLLRIVLRDPHPDVSLHAGVEIFARGAVPKVPGDNGLLLVEAPHPHGDQVAGADPPGLPRGALPSGQAADQGEVLFVGADDLDLAADLDLVQIAGPAGAAPTHPIGQRVELVAVRQLPVGGVAPNGEALIGDLEERAAVELTQEAGLDDLPRGVARADRLPLRVLGREEAHVDPAGFLVDHGPQAHRHPCGQVSRLETVPPAQVLREHGGANAEVADPDPHPPGVVRARLDDLRVQGDSAPGELPHREEEQARVGEPPDYRLARLRVDGEAPQACEVRLHVHGRQLHRPHRGIQHPKRKGAAYRAREVVARAVVRLPEPLALHSAGDAADLG